MSLSSIASSGLRAASRAFEISAQRVSHPSFSEVESTEAVRAVRAEARSSDDALGYLSSPDLATEMVSMISAQRAFTASLTVLKAEDEMTSILVDMKR
jgi:flagellar basal body rod protein FlgG